MIGLLRQYGCSVVVKKGFVFPNKMKSCEMFSFLLEFMQSKNYQDLESKKEKKGLANEYNPALRETYKLLMNSLSGKVIEGLHTEKTIDISSGAEFLKIQEKATKINFINAVGGKMFLTYEVDAETIINQQRPIYLGVLIYDYAKRYMFQNSYAKIGKANLLYTDTDASKFRYKDFITWNINDFENQIDDAYSNTLMDEEVLKKLTSYWGIGPWTADIFMMFCLKRFDTLALGDVGLQRAHRIIYPKALSLDCTSQKWRPYRAIAASYLWKFLDNPECHQAIFKRNS
jgi:DNA-3-methyladenine glycosylase II